MLSDLDNNLANVLLARTKIGATIQVASIELDLKYVSHLVGAEKGEYLITAMPCAKQLKADQEQYQQLFSPNQTFVMRTILDGTAVAFESRLIGLFKQGAKLVISSFPKNMQHVELRKDNRFSCTLVCRVYFTAECIDAVLCNISLGGCQVRIRDRKCQALAEKWKKQKQPAMIQVTFPSIKGEQRIMCDIMSVALCDEEVDVILGMRFKGGNSSVKQFIDICKLEDMPLVVAR